MTITLEAMTHGDWPQVRTVFLEGVASGNATFETTAPSWEAWDASHRADCRLVAREDGLVVGWAALSPVSDRCVYGGVAEVTVYVGTAHRAQGVGRALLTALIECSERHGLWTLQAGLFPENEASVALHRRCGFRKVGRRERLGQLAGRWRDVLLLERRSDRVGTNGAPPGR